jgi:hypothetical protein
MGHPMEASPERLRRHLRRPDAGRGEPVMKTAAYTVRRTDPAFAERHADAWTAEAGDGSAGSHAGTPRRPVVADSDGSNECV